MRIASDSFTNKKTLLQAEEILHVADVADLLHPQYAIITGKYFLLNITNLGKYKGNRR